MVRRFRRGACVVAAREKTGEKGGTATEYKDRRKNVGGGGVEKGWRSGDGCLKGVYEKLKKSALGQIECATRKPTRTCVYI